MKNFEPIMRTAFEYACDIIYVLGKVLQDENLYFNIYRI